MCVEVLKRTVDVSDTQDISGALTVVLKKKNRERISSSVCNDPVVVVTPRIETRKQPELEMNGGRTLAR